MEWEVPGRVRALVVGWSGLSFGGGRTDINITPVSGVQPGESLSSRIQSFAVVGPIGLRVTLISRPGPDWEEHTWRCFHILKPHAFKTPEGKNCVQCPDLDWLHVPNATRVNPDCLEMFPQVDRFEEGTGWTFGKMGSTPMKGNVHLIRLEYAPPEKR